MKQNPIFGKITRLMWDFQKPPFAAVAIKVVESTVAMKDEPDK